MAACQDKTRPALDGFLAGPFADSDSTRRARTSCYGGLCSGEKPPVEAQPGLQPSTGYIARLSQWNGLQPSARPAVVAGRLPCIRHPAKRSSKRKFLRSSGPALPLLVAFGDGRVCSSGLGCVRRPRFMSYTPRDSEFDRICKLLCGTTAQRERRERLEAAGGRSMPTLVALGAAKACSTGFGYAPAPQGRLRHRLAKVHGAQVTLIDEFRTSPVCSCCGGLLERTHRRPKAVLASRSQRAAALLRKLAARGIPQHTLAAMPRRKVFAAVHGVLRCRHCQQRRAHASRSSGIETKMRVEVSWRSASPWRTTASDQKQ